ncbi:MAG: LysM peptidoglycan-binding domain-containing protein, partial [Methyloceanibacter sp.]
HNFRADRIDEAGTVLGSASIGMMRLEPPEQEIAAAPEPAAPPAPMAGSEGAPGEQVAATEEATPAADGEGVPQRRRDRPNVYTVQRGDTLWDIAEEFFGGGWRYRAIVRENRRKIRDPHWIYPDQEFRLPAR